MVKVLWQKKMEMRKRKLHQPVKAVTNLKHIMFVQAVLINGIVRENVRYGFTGFRLILFSFFTVLYTNYNPLSINIDYLCLYFYLLYFMFRWMLGKFIQRFARGNRAWVMCCLHLKCSTFIFVKSTKLMWQFCQNILGVLLFNIVQCIFNEYLYNCCFKMNLYYITIIS